MAACPQEFHSKGHIRRTHKTREKGGGGATPNNQRWDLLPFCPTFWLTGTLGTSDLAVLPEAGGAKRFGAHHRAQARADVGMGVSLDGNGSVPDVLTVNPFGPDCYPHL